MSGVNVYTAREAIDRLLQEPNPSMLTLQMRSANVAKQIADLRRFCPWPALEQSLLYDLRRLSAAFRARGGEPRRLDPVVHRVLEGEQ